MVEKKNKLIILEIIIVFILTLLFNLMCNPISNDDVWNYGFSYNILNGLIPYKDFNMVITPLYPYIGSLIMLIFGKNIIVYYTFGAIIGTSIFYYLKKQNSKSYYFIYAILLFFSMPGYNLFCLLLLYIIMSLEKKQKNDYLIGVFLGLTFLTKQNIGIYLCIPTLLKKDIKIITKRIIGFIIPNIIFIIYLLYNKTLYKFIDYAFLGLENFALSNIKIILPLVIIHLIAIVFLIYKYFKTKENYVFKSII